MPGALQGLPPLHALCRLERSTASPRRAWRPDNWSAHPREDGVWAVLVWRVWPPSSAWIRPPWLAKRAHVSRDTASRLPCRGPRGSPRSSRTCPPASASPGSHSKPGGRKGHGNYALRTDESYTAWLAGLARTRVRARRQWSSPAAGSWPYCPNISPTWPNGVSAARRQLGEGHRAHDDSVAGEAYRRATRGDRCLTALCAPLAVYVAAPWPTARVLCRAAEKSADCTRLSLHPATRPWGARAGAWTKRWRPDQGHCPVRRGRGAPRWSSCRCAVPGPGW